MIRAPNKSSPLSHPQSLVQVAAVVAVPAQVVGKCQQVRVRAESVLVHLNSVSRATSFPHELERTRWPHAPTRESPIKGTKRRMRTERWPDLMPTRRRLLT